MHTQTELQTKLIERARRLYTLPDVAIEVLQLTQQPLIDLPALRACLERDPALTGKILRLVNSSLFGLSRPVTNLQQALAVLGINPLKTLVLGLNLPSTLFMNVHGEVLRKYWQKSLVKAALAREFGRLVMPEQLDELFLAGLLGDVGTLLLIQELGSYYTDFLQTTLSDAEEREHWEFRALGLDHAQLGGAMLHDWKLPGRIGALVDAGTVAARQRQLSPLEQRISSVLELADRISWAWTENRGEMLGDATSRLGTQLKISAEQLLSVAASVREQMDHLATVFAQQKELSLDCERLTQEALARLGELSADELARDMRSRQLRRSEERCDLASQALQSKAPYAWRHMQDLVQEEQVLRQDPWPALKTPENRDMPSPAQPSGDTTTTVTVAPSPAALVLKQLRPLLSEALHAQGYKRPTAEPTACDTAEPASERSNIEPALRATLATTILQCRQRRTPLSLVLLTIAFEPNGDDAAQAQAISLLKQRLRNGDFVGQTTMELHFGKYAVILPDCERRAAVQWSTEILRHAQGVAQPLDSTLSIGVASIASLPRNFPADSLVVAARRCLDGAQISGGRNIKSIEVN